MSSSSSEYTLVQDGDAKIPSSPESDVLAGEENGDATSGGGSTSTFACPLCCEDKPITERRVLTNRCHHDANNGCHDCLVKWIEKVESTGQQTLPGCPWCRVVLSEEETQQILGRPFRPISRTAQNGSGNGVLEEMDELTRQFLESETQRCLGCGALVSKIQDGSCDLMECLCGYRWCWNCGTPNAHCNCTPAHHFFWDNLLDTTSPRQQQPSDRAYTATIGSTATTTTTTNTTTTTTTSSASGGDGAGQQQQTPTQPTRTIDLKSHIEQRLQKGKASKLKKERQQRRIYNHYECRTLDRRTSSAMWLFQSSSMKNGLRILQEISQTATVRTTRSQRRKDNAQQLHEMEEAHHDYCYYYQGAKWLFGDATTTNKKAKSGRTGGRGLGVGWLNCITKPTNEILEIRRDRKRQLVRYRREILLAGTSVLAAHWMFATSTRERSYQLLAKQTNTASGISSSKNKTPHADKKEKEDQQDPTGALVPIRNGTWLFRSSKPTKTIQQLERLYRHLTVTTGQQKFKPQQQQQHSRRLPIWHSKDVKYEEKQNHNNCCWLFGNRSEDLEWKLYERYMKRELYVGKLVGVSKSQLWKRKIKRKLKEKLGIPLKEKKKSNNSKKKEEEKSSSDWGSGKKNSSRAAATTTRGGGRYRKKKLFLRGFSSPYPDIGTT